MPVITVILPNALRPFAAYNDRVALEAGTVGEALAKLIERYPELSSRVSADLASTPPGSGVFRGGQDVRNLQGAATALGPNDMLTLIVPEGYL